MPRSWFSKWFSGLRRSESGPASSTVNVSDAEAQFGLGLKCALSGGETPDYGQAAEWYRKAADQNHCLAQFNLGIMYAQGQGVERDGTQSTQWFLKAALQGDAGAQFRLGENYHHASFKGNSKDAIEARIEAYKWLQLAAAQGYWGSDAACATLLFKMTCEDVRAGDQRVASFSVDGNASRAG